MSVLFFPNDSFLPDKFYSFIYLSNILNAFLLKPIHAVLLSVVHRPWLLRSPVQLAAPCELELAFMLWDWHLGVHLGMDNLLGGCGPWAVGVSLWGEYLQGCLFTLYEIHCFWPVFMLPLGFEYDTLEIVLEFLPLGRTLI